MRNPKDFRLGSVPFNGQDLDIGKKHYFESEPVHRLYKIRLSIKPFVVYLANILATGLFPMRHNLEKISSFRPLAPISSV